MKGLRDKLAIVTGGGGGIGRAICLRLAKDGCRVAVMDLDAAAAGETVDALQADGGQAVASVVDITDHAAVAAAVGELRGEHGAIDILVNNAGWDRGAPFVKTSPEFWAKVIAVNYVGPLNLHHTVLPLMIEQGHGRVVNISSDAGRVGSSGEAVYAGCKAALLGFGKSVAREVAKSGICINAICPGPTDSAMFYDGTGEGEFGERLRAGLERAIPMRRLGQPEDIAGLVAFLASDEASFITGQVISVSGGLSMVG
jgi:2-hydroxycyclohexanecarboxyl-CoA dehydrogenase